MFKQPISSDDIIDKMEISIFCNRCDDPRPHRVLYADSVLWNVGRYKSEDIFDIDNHILIRCECCNWTTYLRDYVTTPKRGHSDYDEVSVSRSTYPVKSTRRPLWLHLVTVAPGVRYAFREDQPKLFSLVEQMYRCLDHKSYTAAALLSRSILETVMLRWIKDTGSISGNIRSFRSNGCITQMQSEQMEYYAMDVGNAAMHRSHNPTVTQVMAAVEFTVSLIETLYVTKHLLKIHTMGLPPRA